MTIGEKLRICRKWANLTQKELGEKIGIDGATVGKYERGILNPKRETLIKFEDALNYVHGTFYRDTDETPQNGRNVVDDFDGLGIEYADIETEQVTQSATQKQLNKYLESTFLKLNEEGQRVAIERMEELAQIPKYQRREENDVDEAPAGDDLTPDDPGETDPTEKA